MKQKSSLKRLDVQGLRAFAVILVILFHATVPGFSQGFLGVDIFFVISGFVITGALLRSEKASLAGKLNEFYRKRILRIVPAATVTLVATALAAYFFLGPFTAIATLDDVRWATLFSFNFRMINQGLDYFASSGTQFSTVLHFWSLSVEEQFYFVYPLILLGILMIAKGSKRLAIGFVGAATVASLFFAFTSQETDSLTAFYSPFARVWEFGLGCLVCLILMMLKEAPKFSTVWSLLPAAFLIAMFTEVSVPLETRILIADLASALIIFIGSSTTLKGFSFTKLLSTRPLVFIGDASYSLYLWHYIWLTIPLQLSFDGLSGLQILYSLAGTTACALASFYLIENPLRRSKVLGNSKLLPYALLVISLSLVFVICYLIENYWV